MTDDEVYFFQHQLNAAEVWDFYTWSAEARRLESKLERAEAVIEAARDHHCAPGYVPEDENCPICQALDAYDKERNSNV